MTYYDIILKKLINKGSAIVKSKQEPINNFGNDTEKLLVQKSKPLFALWQSELTLAEFKILDSYLGRINSHDEEHRTVKFNKGELEHLLGVKQLKPQVLDERLEHLMTTIRIVDENCKNGFTRIALFEKAHAEQDEYGLWTAELTCTESARKYIFNIDEIKYLRYKLKNIVNIKSRYTYIMFLYLWENKYRSTWEVSLDDLKSLLNCNNEQSYNQFKVFNDRILKRVHKEIHTVTDMRYDYETTKKGRRVSAIRFTYHSQAQQLEENLTTNTDKYINVNIDHQEVDYGGELANMLAETCNYEFDSKQIRYIQDLVLQATKSNDNVVNSDYLTEKMHRMALYNAKNQIKNRYNYLVKMIQQEIKR